MIDAVRPGQSTSLYSRQLRPASQAQTPSAGLMLPPQAPAPQAKEAASPASNSLALLAAATLLPDGPAAEVDMSRLQQLVGRIYGDMAQFASAGSETVKEGESLLFDILL